MIQQAATELAVPYDEIAGCGVRVGLTPTPTRVFVSLRFESADDPAAESDDLYLYATGLVHDLTVAQAQLLHEILGTLLGVGDAGPSTGDAS